MVLRVLLVKYSSENPDLLRLLSEICEGVEVIAPAHNGLWGVGGSECEWGDHSNVRVHLVTGNDVLYPFKAVLKSLRLDFDLILNRNEFWGIAGALIKLVKRKRMLSFITLERAEIHGLIKPNSIKSRVERRLINFVSRIVVCSSDMVVVPSHKLEKRMRELSDNVHINRVPGIDLNRFHPRDMVGGQRVGYIGRLSPEKNVSVLRKVSEYIPITVVGGGPESHHFEGCNNIDLCGYIEHDEVPELMSELSVYVQPSVSEAFPWSVIEALACGTPLVTTRVGGIRDYANEKNAIIIDNPYDDMEYVNKIKGLLDNPKKRKKLKHNGVRTAKKYSSDKEGFDFHRLLRFCYYNMR